MVREEWSRSTINDRIGKIKQAFRWAAKCGKLPSDVWAGLSTVDGLSARDACKQGSPVRPVSEEDIVAAKRYVSPVVAAMIELQLLTGARPGGSARAKSAAMATGSGFRTWRLTLKSPWDR